MKISYLKIISPKSVLMRNGWIYVFILFGLISSCVSPDPFTDLSPEKKDLYITNRDKSIDFANYKKYFLVDSVQVVTKEFGSTEESVNAAPLILNTIKSEMDKNGFVQVTDINDADVAVVASVLKFTEQLPATFFPYIGGSTYFGYAPPAFYGFTGYAYGFPSYYGYYQIEVGSISIDMYDLKTARLGGQTSVNIIWNAILAGSLAGTGTDENNGERIVNAITGAFQQSPYLKDGK